MLNIPEEVKRLLKQDSVKKNFRVHFPNGEYDDITNGNLVAESVVLTESLCSGQNIKFGLCEASQLEFETIGVGNIKGCEIQAFIEVDISSLPSDIIATIDYMYLNDGTIAYQIPYGVFTVDSCKRQNDMSKRKIIAYSKNILDKIELSSIEKEKEQFVVNRKSDYKVNLVKTLYSNINMISEDMYTETSYSVNVYDDYLIGYGAVIDAVYTNIEVKAGVLSIKTSDPESENLYKITLNKVGNYNSVVESAVKVLKEYSINVPDANYQTYMDVFYKLYEPVYDGATVVNVREKIVPRENNNLIYPYIPGVTQTDLYGQIIIPLEIYVRKRSTEDPNAVALIHEWKFATDFTVSRIEPTGLFADKTITLKRNKVGVNKYATSEQLNLRKILESWTELQGKFAYNSRYGGVSLISIKEKFGLYPSEDLYPSEELYPREPDDIVSTSLYSNVWYEEYTVQKYGRLLIPYINEENETEEFWYVFNEDNKNTYFFSENYLLSLYSFTQDEIKEIIDTYFLPHIEYITYVPAEITMRGLPYLEVGDVVSVLTNSGYSFETIVWQRKLKGIQALTDSVTATGDEVNEKVSESVTII